MAMLIRWALFMCSLLAVASLQAVFNPDGSQSFQHTALTGAVIPADGKPLLHQRSAIAGTVVPTAERPLAAIGSTNPIAFSEQRHNAADADFKGYFRDSTTGIITKYCFDAHSGGNHGESNYECRLPVDMAMNYNAKIEVLRCDLGQASEYAKHILLDNKDVGECNPDGGDYDCTYFDCGLNAVVGPTAATVKIELTMTGASKDCDCNENTGECSKEGTVAGRTPVKGGVRLTLTPAITEGTITKVIYVVDDGGNFWSEAFMGSIMVTQGLKYTASAEVLRDDLGQASEYVKSLFLGGVNLGECHPDGGDYDCTWFSCSAGAEVTAFQNNIDLHATFTGHSCDCLCDTNKWECKDERQTNAGTRIKAAVRITLEPIATPAPAPIGPPDPKTCTGDCR